MFRLLKLFSQIDINPGELDIPKIGELDDSTADSTIAALLELAFGFAAAIAMIVIIIAGIQFTLSRGDPEKAATARRAIIYAAVGLALASLAFGIVRFVVRSV